MDAGSDSRPVGKNRARLRWHNVRMPDEHTLTLRQAHQARTDFALIEDQLEFIMGQLARAPTRAYLCRTLLLATARLGLARSGLAADAVVPRLSGVVVRNQKGVASKRGDPLIFCRPGTTNGVPPAAIRQ
jgi:hypothetical protein